jgi:hypothetical protein
LDARCEYGIPNACHWPGDLLFGVSYQMTILIYCTFSKLTLRSLVLAASAICGDTSAQTLSLTPSTELASRSPSATLPGNLQELWSRILILLKTNEGFVRHLEVEETIGLKFTSVKKGVDNPLLGADFFYMVEEAVPGIGLLRITLFEDPKQISLGFRWGFSAFELPGCKNLTVNQVQNEIENLDWIAKGPRSDRPGPNNWSFVRRVDVERKAKEQQLESTFSNHRTFENVSTLLLSMPNQSTQCLSGFRITIVR